MERLSKKLTNLRSQVQKLNTLFKQLNLKNVELKQENQELLEKLERKTNRIKELKEERELIINAKSLNEVGLAVQKRGIKLTNLYGE